MMLNLFIPSMPCDVFLAVSNTARKFHYSIADIKQHLKQFFITIHLLKANLGRVYYLLKVLFSEEVLNINMPERDIFPTSTSS